MRRLFLAALAAASLAIVSDAYSQAQQNFTLINRSGQQIDEVYVSATSQNEWGRDILGDGVMPSGTRRNITFPSAREPAVSISRWCSVEASPPKPAISTSARSVM